jgi:hypothetical protein
MVGRKNTQPGIGVDAAGGGVIDPTKNVEDLVNALSETLDKLRHADGKRLDDLREADQKRLGEIAALKREYDKQIFDIQTVQVKTTSDLISAQLSKETASLANQINAATVQNQGLIQTLSARIDKLEQARYETAGRASVQDPATAEALAKMSAAVGTLIESKYVGAGHSKGIGDSWGWLVGVVGAIWAVIATADLLIKHN